MAHFSPSLSALFLALLALTAQALTVPLATLSKTTLQPIKDGAVSGKATTLGGVLGSDATVVFAVRRPG